MGHAMDDLWWSPRSCTGRGATAARYGKRIDTDRVRRSGVRSMSSTMLSATVGRRATTRTQMFPYCFPVMAKDPSLADVVVPKGEKEYGG